MCLLLLPCAASCIRLLLLVLPAGAARARPLLLATAARLAVSLEALAGVSRQDWPEAKLLDFPCMQPMSACTSWAMCLDIREA